MADGPWHQRPRARPCRLPDSRPLDADAVQGGLLLVVPRAARDRGRGGELGRHHKHFKNTSLTSLDLIGWEVVTNQASKSHQSCADRLFNRFERKLLDNEVHILHRAHLAVQS